MKKILILLLLSPMALFSQVKYSYVKTDSLTTVTGTTINVGGSMNVIDTLFINYLKTNGNVESVGTDSILIKSSDGKAYFDLASKFINSMFDSINFNRDADISFSRPYSIYPDTVNGTLSIRYDEMEFLNQLSQEVVLYGQNNSASTINNFEVVYVDDVDVSPRGFKKAIANDRTLILHQHLIATHDIEVGTKGYAVRFGEATGNTSAWNLGDILYLSPFDSGQLTNIEPTLPNYPIPLAQVRKVDAVDGKLEINADRFSEVETGLAADGIFNGIIIQTQAVRDTLIGSTLYFETYNEEIDTLDVPFMASGLIYTLNTTTNTGTNGYARVALTFGTESAPMTNYIYIDNSGTPTLTVSTSAFPENGIRVAECAIFDSANHVDFGFASFQRFDNALNGSVANGWINKAGKRIRLDGSKWGGIGVLPTLSITTDAADIDSIHISVNAGVVWQFNEQTSLAIPRREYYWFNCPSGGKWVTDLNQVDSTSTGEALLTNNSRYGLNVFKIQSSGDLKNIFLVSSPSGKYSSNDNAINDITSYAVTSVPAQWTQTAIRVARIVVQYTTASNGTITNIIGTGLYQDERGFALGSTSGSGTTGGGSVVADSSWLSIMVDTVHALTNGQVHIIDTLDLQKHLRVGHTITGDGEMMSQYTVDAGGFDEVSAISIRYDLGDVDNEEGGFAILINADATDAINGNFGGLVVARTEGEANVFAVVATPEVHPLLHLSGGFEDLTTGTVNGVDEVADLNNVGATTPVFVADDDSLIIGLGSIFGLLNVVLNTVSSHDIESTFEYSTGVNTWGTLTVTDGTLGFTEPDGVIIWQPSLFPLWVTGAGGDYLVKITRTRNGLPTNPIIQQLQISQAVEYGWFKDGTILNDTTFSNAVYSGGLELAPLDSIHFRKVGDYVKLKDITDTLLIGMDTFPLILRPNNHVRTFEHNATMAIKSGITIMPDATFGNANLNLISNQPSAGTGHGTINFGILNNDGQPIHHTFEGPDIINGLVGVDSLPSLHVILGAYPKTSTTNEASDLLMITVQDSAKLNEVRVPQGLMMLNSATPRGIMSFSMPNDDDKVYEGLNLAMLGGHSNTPYRNGLFRFTRTEGGLAAWNMDSTYSMNWYDENGSQNPLSAQGAVLKFNESEGNSKVNWTVNQWNVVGSNGSSFFNKFYSTNYTLKIISGDSSIVPLKHDVQLVIQNQLNASNTYGWLMNQNKGSVENAGIGFVNYGATASDYKGGIGLVTRSTLTEKGIRLYVNAVGNVMIGDTTDNNLDLLQVNGNANISDTLKANILKGQGVATVKVLQPQ